MELVSASPRIKVEFEASFPQNLLTVALLLRVADRFEGLSDWVVHTLAALPADLAADLRTFALITVACQGLWSDFIRAGRGSEPGDMSRLLSQLEQQPDEALREAARRGLDGRLVEWKLARPGAAEQATRDELSSLLDRMWDERRRRGEGPGDETTADSDLIARFLSEPDLLRRHAVAVLRAVWEVYREQSERDWAQIERAVAYHRQQRYPQEFNAGFVAITGRAVPDRLADQLDETRHVVMTPVSHIGPYLLLTRYEDRVLVSFNANTAPSVSSGEEKIAALYPPLKALADETRLQIVSLLASGERYVGEIAELLELSQSSASRHLRLLAAAEILSVRRENNQKYFRINPERARALITDLQHHLRL
jgi:DNA-binding transcriptional ArsR family regulator